jgi:hypothetical protein
MYIVGMNLPCVMLRLLDVDADIIENLGHRANVADVGHIPQRDWLLSQQASGQQRQRRVLVPAWDKCSGDWSSTLYQEFLHSIPS